MPKWLVIFNLHVDCELIISQFNNQSPHTRNWNLLIWAYRVLRELPDLSEESDWPRDINIPSLSVEDIDEPSGFLHQVVIILV